MALPSNHLERCPRCGSVVDVYDMESDPRWGDVCDCCHDELLDEHGEFDGR